MMFRRAIFLFFCVLATMAHGQQPTPIAVDPAVRKSIQDFQQNSYPAFITDLTITPQPAPRANDEETTAPITRGPELLVDDVESTTTWINTRARLQPALEELRLTMLSSAADSEISAATEKLSQDLSRVAIMAPGQAPLHSDEVASILNRIDKQVEFILNDYSARDFKRLQSSQDLLQRSVDDLEQVLRESDEDRGKPGSAPVAIPNDWNADGFSSEAFADGIRTMRARETLSAYSERIDTLASKLHSRRLSSNRDVEVAVEMGELARHLALRANEVPVTSQVPFRNAALRLDVLSESLGEYIRDDKSAYTKRQLRYARDCVQRCEGFLSGSQLAPSSITSSSAFPDAIRR
ncbi:MAG: hypothetical protein ABI579_01595 [Candidatus Sumerlaeota bacterium]